MTICSTFQDLPWSCLFFWLDPATRLDRRCPIRFKCLMHIVLLFVCAQMFAKPLWQCLCVTPHRYQWYNVIMLHIQINLIALPFCCNCNLWNHLWTSFLSHSLWPYVEPRTGLHNAFLYLHLFLSPHHQDQVLVSSPSGTQRQNTREREH